MSNQWPEFAVKPKPETVRKAIIDEGTGIAERTDSHITFEVSSLPEGKGLVHNCFLVVPKFAYRYTLFRVEQDGFAYPVTIHADVWRQGKRADNEAELRKNLGVIFQAPETQNVVLQLLDMLS